MRVSDWSSVVCSSDLCWRGALGRDRRIRRQGRSRPLRKRSARLAMRTEARGWMTDYIPFDWQDLFRLDDQIAPEEGAIRDLARDYCQTERKSTRLNSSH